MNDNNSRCGVTVLQGARKTSVYLFIVALCATVQAVSSAEGWSKQELARARAFSETLDTAAVVILHNGDLVDQWGAVALPLKCHSTRKSILSAVFGPHVEAGTIALDATLKQLGINDCEPSLTDEERSATIRDLLNARSGIYHPALYETAAMAARRSRSPKRIFRHFKIKKANAKAQAYDQRDRQWSRGYAIYVSSSTDRADVPRDFIRVT